MLKTCFLLMLATATQRSFLHALSVAPAHIVFVRGDVGGQPTLSLLPKPGFIAKNQLPDQVPPWVKIPGIDHLVPQDSDRVLCPVRQLYLYISDTNHVRRSRTRLRRLQHTSYGRWLLRGHICRISHRRMCFLHHSGGSLGCSSAVTCGTLPL